MAAAAAKPARDITAAVAAVARLKNKRDFCNRESLFK
jgi:hypothetical protein